ncbi:hypothetical protein OGCDGJMD_01465 [Cyanobium usitatum str. Tous]|nr:hypothetical protein OGCDGJMD_01465 [Cyanobium usitatum str. Tous]
MDPWKEGSGPFEHPEHHQQDHRTEGGHHNAAQQAAAHCPTETAEEKTTEQGADDAHHQIPDEPEASPFDENPGKPAGNHADEEEPENVHGGTCSGEERHRIVTLVVATAMVS